jgi:hypothetical protein
MAGNPKNTEIGIRGSDVTLDAWFRSYSGGPLTDPDTTPTYIIYDPSNTSMATGSGTKVSTGYYTATYSVPSNATISKLWKIVWTADIGGVAVSGSEEYFEVVASGATDFAQTAIITDFWLNMIKKPLAYPSEDNIILTDDEIKALCVYPALRDYFVKFPIRSTTEHELTTDADNEIAFPDADTYGVIDARLIGKGTLSGSGNSFWDLVYHQQMGIVTNRGSSWGIPKYNPGGVKQARSLVRMAAATQDNYGTTDIRVSEENSQVVMHTNMNGKANITWAKMSSDFEDVRFVYKNDVVKLSSAYLMEHLAQTTGLINTNLEISIDSSTLRDEAKEMRTEVMERWQEIPSVIIIRST